METGSLQSFYEFENEGFFSAGQGHMVRFALTTMSGGAVAAVRTDFFFQGKEVSELDDPRRHFTLAAEDIALLNPNSRTCPIFRTKPDAEITKAIYRRVPVLIIDGPPEQNPWGLTFLSMFHMSNDSGLFRTREQLEAEGWKLKGNVFCKGAQRYLPFYEAKMVHQYDHRHGDFADIGRGQRTHVLPAVAIERLSLADYVTLPFYWVPESDVAKRLKVGGGRGWFVVWRDVTDARASARTLIASVVPRAGVVGDLPMMLSNRDELPLLFASLNSFIVDYVARQKVSGLHLKFYTMRQLPTLRSGRMASLCDWCEHEGGLRGWILARALELTFTAWDMEPFGMDCGWSGAPFRWDEERRFLLRCELDAAFLHLYMPATAGGRWRPARRRRWRRAR